MRLLVRAGVGSQVFQEEGFIVLRLEMGKVAKGQQCNVIGCSGTAIRSLSPDKVTHAGINIGKAHRAYLCKVHYREYKKRSKKDRQIDKWRFSA